MPLFVWVLFIFHLNRSRSKETSGQTFTKIQAKISVPKLDSGKIGCFATRSPDRPNPIGLSLCRLTECLEDGQGGWMMTLEGVDMIQHTPIIDVKVATEIAIEVEYPEWVVKNLKRHLIVYVGIAVHLQMRKDQTEPKILQLAIQSLELDPRSRHTKQRHPHGIFAHRIGSHHVALYRFEGVRPSACVQLCALWHIDSMPFQAPLRSQEFYNKAKRFLSIVLDSSLDL